MTERFTKGEFEEALPKHKVTGEELWQELGDISGEYCYLLPVRAHVAMMIRSSVTTLEGVAAGTALNSIRVWLVDAETLEPLGHKMYKNYTTRVPGWEARLNDLLRDLWPLALRLAKPCRCGGKLSIFKVKKDGPNKGRPFLTCSSPMTYRGPQGKKSCNYFEWLDANQEVA